MRKFLAVIFAVVLAAGILSGCKTKNEIPFSQASWDWTQSDMEKAEGSNYKTGTSVYGGVTCSYDKTYLGSDGTIKYMFDEKGVLASVAWAYADKDAGTVQKLYETIRDREEKEHGDSGFSNPNETASGDVWYLEDCTALVTMLTTENGSALQYAYVQKAYSKR